MHLAWGQRINKHSLALYKKIEKSYNKIHLASSWVVTLRQSE